MGVAVGRSMAAAAAAAVGVAVAADTPPPPVGAEVAVGVGVGVAVAASTVLHTELDDVAAAALVADSLGIRRCNLVLSPELKAYVLSLTVTSPISIIVAKTPPT